MEIALHYNARDFDHWCHLVQAFEVTRVHALGLPVDYETAVWHSCGDFTDIDSGLTRVVVQPADGKYQVGETPLPEFTHPVNAIYIFGSDDQHNPAVECDASVRIPTVKSAVTLYAAQAALLVLYDRCCRGDS